MKAELCDECANELQGAYNMSLIMPKGAGIVLPPLCESCSKNMASLIEDESKNASN